MNPDERTREEIHAEDRRVPVRRERHDPVDRCKGLRQRQDDQRGAGEAAQAGGHRGIPRRILAARSAVIREGDDGPDHEEERRPNQEERHVQVRRFPVQQSILLGGPGDGPRIERVQAEQHRHEQDRHHRQHGEDGLADAPQHDAPSALRGVLDQHEEERAERERQEEQERDEPREIELLRIPGSQHRADRRPQQRQDGADHRQTIPRVTRRDRGLLGPELYVIAFVGHQDSRSSTLRAPRDSSSLAVEAPRTVDPTIRSK